MSDDINGLRAELFATLRALRDPENPMDISRAKAVSDVAQTVINSVKVEVDFINAVGTKRLQPTGFVGLPAPDTLTLQEKIKGPPTPVIPGVMPSQGPRGAL